MRLTTTVSGRLIRPCHSTEDDFDVLPARDLIQSRGPGAYVPDAALTARPSMPAAR